MMDFVVRETRAIVDGPMAIIRLGTCGAVRDDVPLGSVVVASKGSILIQRNPDTFGSNSEEGESYLFRKPVSSDPQLSDRLVNNLKLTVHSGVILEGMNASADTFYSSQGRHDLNFRDNNQHILSHLGEKFPDVVCLEMETFHLFDLARSSCCDTITATAATIVLAQRKSNEFLDHQTLHKLEVEAGAGVLNTLAELNLQGKIMDNDQCVWNQVK